MRSIVLILAVAAATAHAAAHSLSNSDANFFFSAMTASGAPVVTTGQNRSVTVRNLVCLKTPRADGTFLQVCSFRANGTHQVLPAQVQTVMNLLKRAGFVAGGGAGNEVYRVNSAQCATYRANSQAPRTECSFDP